MRLAVVVVVFLFVPLGVFEANFSLKIHSPTPSPESVSSINEASNIRIIPQKPLNSPCEIAKKNPQRNKRCKA